MASSVSELVETLPKIAACQKTKSFLSNVTRFGGIGSMLHSKTNSKYLISAHVPAADVDSKNGVPTGAVLALLKEARHIVVAARSALS